MENQKKKMVQSIIEDLIRQLREITAFCQEKKDSGAFDEGTVDSSGNCATMFDRFNLTTFARQYRALAQLLQVQVSKVVVVSSRIPMSKDSQPIVKRFFELYQRLVDMADSYPPQFGLYCKRSIMRRCGELNDCMLQFTSQFASKMSDINSAISVQNHVDAETLRTEMMKSLLQISGRILHHCDNICQMDPLDNKNAVLQQFRYLVEYFDDVSMEIDELIDGDNDSDAEDSVDVPVTSNPSQNQQVALDQQHREVTTGQSTTGEVEQQTAEVEEDVEMDPLYEFQMKLAQGDRQLTIAELDASRKVERLISSASLLLRKIATRTIAEQVSESRQEDIMWLDEIIGYTPAVPAIIDELGSECHPPQSLEQIAKHARLFAELMNRFLELARSREYNRGWFDQWNEQWEANLTAVLDLAPIR